MTGLFVIFVIKKELVEKPASRKIRQMSDNSFLLSEDLIVPPLLASVTMAFPGAVG